MSDPTTVSRRLVAVFAADVEGYSRLMGADEVGTLEGLTERRAILDRFIGDHRGRIANTAGDSVLAEFGSAVDAVQCAVHAQAALAEANAGLALDRRISFRIGVHIGDVMVRAGDLFGDGVNIAARLQTLANPGAVCISGATYDQVRKVLPMTFEDLGLQNVKNIQEPIRTYQVGAPSKMREATLARIADTESPPPLPDKPSIAVLPFQNMSGDPEQEYFADGVVEDIITALSRFKVLFVIARNSSFTYKGKTVGIKQVGRELGVRYVLEGSVRKAGGRVRIVVQLIDAGTGHHVWADKFEGELQDLFGFQDEITARVVGALVPALELTEMARAKRTDESSLSAYDLFLRARALTYRAQMRPAIELCYEAIKKDPEFAQAYAAAAYAHMNLQSFQGLPLEPEERENAITLANQALSLDGNDAAILYRAGHVLAYFAKELERGSTLIEQAVTLNANLSDIWAARGWTAVMNSDGERAVESFFQFFRISPMDPTRSGAWSGLSYACFLLGRYDEGCSWATKALQDAPTVVIFLGGFIVNAVCARRFDEARAAATRLIRSQPEFRLRYVDDLFVNRDAELIAKAKDALRAVDIPE
jgi:adenylate cyclase